MLKIQELESNPDCKRLEFKLQSFFRMEFKDHFHSNERDAFCSCLFCAPAIKNPARLSLAESVSLGWGLKLDRYYIRQTLTLTQP